TDLNMDNKVITGADSFSISDVGPGEGLSFISASASDWAVDVTPLNRSNADGNLNLYGTSNNIALWRPTLFVYNASNYSTAAPQSSGGLNFTSTVSGHIP